MKQALAYHAVTLAMEGAAGLSPADRFALAIRHAVDGHVDHDRYRRAAIARKRGGAGPDSIDRAVADWLATDLNPATRAIGMTSSPANAAWGYNAYNLSARLGVRTSVDPASAAPGELARFARREMRAQGEDPELCAVGTISVLERLLGRVSRNAKAGGPRLSMGIVEVGSLLGVGACASFQAAQALREIGTSDFARVASRLGASGRALRRALSDEGVSLSALAMATRLARATDLLASSLPLAEVAFASGFSDMSHMSRAFRASCGMPPSLLRQVVRGGVAPEPALAVPADWAAAG